MNNKQVEDWHMLTSDRRIRCLWVLIVLIVGIVGAGIGFYLIWQNVMWQAAQ